MASINIGKKDIFWSYIGSFFRLAANILLLPFMLHYLSDEDLGLWYVFAGIAQFVVLLDFGFAPSLARNISYIWCGARELKKDSVTSNKQENTDYVEFKKILTTCKYIYLTISLVALLLLSTVGTYYIATLNSDNEYAFISWAIYGLGIVLNLYYSYFTTFLRGVGAVAENNIAGVLSKTCQIIISCLLLYYGWGILGASIGYLISGIILRFYSVYAFYSYDNIGKSLKSIKSVITLKDCWDMFVVVRYNAFKEGLIMISNYLTTQANTLMCSSVLGLATTGSYGISVQLATIITGISNIPYSTYQPKMMEKILKGETDKSLSLFSGAFLMFTIVYFFLSLGVLMLIPMIRILKPGFNLDYSMLIVLFFYMFTDRAYHNFASYISNFNKLPYTYPFIISSFFSVILSFFFAKVGLGLWALIIAPLIIACLYNAWRWPLYVLKENGMGIVGFCRVGVDFIKDIVLNKIIKRAR